MNARQRRETRETLIGGRPARIRATDRKTPLGHVIHEFVEYIDALDLCNGCDERRIDPTSRSGYCAECQAEALALR